MKVILDFDSISEIEKEWFLKNTWCDICSEADLGITKPKLYLENGMKYIFGNCNGCGAV